MENREREPRNTMAYATFKMYSKQRILTIKYIKAQRYSAYSNVMRNVQTLRQKMQQNKALVLNGTHLEGTSSTRQSNKVGPIGCWNIESYACDGTIEAFVLNVRCITA